MCVMRSYLLHPVALIGEGLLLAGALTLRAELIVLGALVWIGWAAALGMRSSQRRASVSLLEQVSNANRTRFLPLHRLYGQIEQIVRQNESNPAVSVIGGEALSEAEGILNEAVRVLAVRDQVIRAAQNIHVAANRAQRSASEANSPSGTPEGQANEAVGRIDAVLRESEAVLAELLSRLSAAVVEQAQTVGGDEISDTLSRLKALSTSLEEVASESREAQA